MKTFFTFEEKQRIYNRNKTKKYGKNLEKEKTDQTDKYGLDEILEEGVDGGPTTKEFELPKTKFTIERQ